MVEVITKKCNFCKQWFPATNEYFHRNRALSDGLDSYCKPCKRKKAKLSYQKKQIAYEPVSKDMKCANCVFLKTCKHGVKIPDWWPYCFVISKYHNLYLVIYGSNGSAENEHFIDQ